MEDRDLREVDDRSGHDRAELAWVGDGEPPAPYLIRHQLARTPTPRQILDPRRKPFDRQLVSAVNHGNDEPILAQRHRDPEADVLMDRVAVILEPGVQ